MKALTVCQPYPELMYPQLADRAHCFGPWCWVLTDVRRLPVPVPWRGAQGLWECDAPIGCV